VQLIINRAYGFHFANAALALIMVILGPITHVLPHERSLVSDGYINPHLCQEAQKWYVGDEE
jgi:hypothetical protein